MAIDFKNYLYNSGNFNNKNNETGILPSLW
jgi:hypothetical protein